MTSVGVVPTRFSASYANYENRKVRHTVPPIFDKFLNNFITTDERYAQKMISSILLNLLSISL